MAHEIMMNHKTRGLVLVEVPVSVLLFAEQYGCWLVGSRGTTQTAINEDSDWDLIVPFHLWHPAARCIPSDAKPTTLGGWRFTGHDGAKIDIWPDSIGRVLIQHPSVGAYHLNSGTRIEVKR